MSETESLGIVILSALAGMSFGYWQESFWAGLFTGIVVWMWTCKSC